MRNKQELAMSRFTELMKSKRQERYGAAYESIATCNLR